MSDTDPKDKSKAQASGEDGYERTDANIKAVFGIALAILIFALGCALVVNLMYDFFDGRSKSPQSESAEKARERVRDRKERSWMDRLDKEPPLQESPEKDMREFRKREAERLASYGWVDPQKKDVAHIPIEDAMKRVLEKGLPTSKTTTAFNAPNGTARPAETPQLIDKEETLRRSGDANSGRLEGKVQ
jgi:hypothetical protein